MLKTCSIILTMHGVLQSGLAINDMLKIGMDGPNVNWKFYNLCITYLRTRLQGVKIIYRKVSSSTVLPLKFVSHRWLENVPVTERALQILKCIRMYVKAVRDETVTHPGNKSFEVVAESIDDPGNKSFEVVAESIDDPLIEAKLQKCSDAASTFF